MIAITIGIEGVAAEMHGHEVGVVDFHFGGAKIRDVKKFLTVDFAGSGAFVDRAVGRTVIGVVDHEDGVLPTVPAGDGSILSRENKVGRCSGSARNGQEIGGAAIEDDACGGRLGSCWRALWRGNGDGASAVDRNDGTGAGVKGGGARIVVGDPKRAAARRAGEAPGILKIGVGNRGHTGEVRYQVRLFVMLRLRCSREQGTCKERSVTQMVKFQKSESMHRNPYRTLEGFIPRLEWWQRRMRRAGGR